MPKSSAAHSARPLPAAPTLEEAICVRLDRLIEILAESPSDLSVGGLDTDSYVQNAPVPGGERYVISSRRAMGGDNFTVPAATPVLLAGGNAGRIGGSVVNFGANPVFLYLCGKGEINFGQTGKFTLVLNTNCSWDLKLSSQVWTGPISCYSVLGTSLAWGIV